MTAPVLPNVRVEILVGAAANLVGNHSANTGNTSGWALDGSGTGRTLTAASGLAFGPAGKALKVTGATTSSSTTGSDGIAYQDYADGAAKMDGTTPNGRVPIVGGQWINFAVTGRAPDGETRSATIEVKFYNGAGTEVGGTGWLVGAEFTSWAASQDNTYTGHSATPWTGTPGAVQAPAGTATARLSFAWHVPNLGAHPHYASQPTWWHSVFAVVADSKSGAAYPVWSDEPEDWQNIVTNAISCNISRGGDVDGVTDQLDAGTMTATIADPLFTPDTNDRVRPGKPIRVTGQTAPGVWANVFRGKINQATTAYPSDVPVVTLTATDAMADLANRVQPLGKSGRFKQRVDSAMVDVPVTYTVADTAADTSQSIIGAAESATVADQLTLIRDSLQGLFYVDKTNVLKTYAANSYPAKTPATVELSDTHADPGAIKYHAITTAFDSKNIVNTLTVTKEALTEVDGAKVYGPYTNAASVDAWGSISANLVVNSGEPWVLAADYLAVYGTPTIHAESVTYEASEAVGTAVARELYEVARVKCANASGLDATYRTIGIEHEIGPESWVVTLRFKPLETVSTITVTNPPGGAGTGPKDLVPYTQQPQAGTVSVGFSASSLASSPVVFPVPYPSPPKVVASTSHASFFAAATSVTATGFTLQARLYTGTTSATITGTWVAML